jgi:hypothetical protein
MQYEIWHTLKERVDLSLVKMKAVEVLADKTRLTAGADIEAVDHEVHAATGMRLGNEMRFVLVTNLDHWDEKNASRYLVRKDIASVNSANSRAMEATAMAAENVELVVVDGVTVRLIAIKTVNSVVVSLVLVMAFVDHLRLRLEHTLKDRVKFVGAQ